MTSGSIGASLAAWVGAALSSLCCVLPLAVILLGLGSGAFMPLTMQYRWVLIPAGLLGVATGFSLYARERRRCARLACRMAEPPHADPSDRGGDDRRRGDRSGPVAHAHVRHHHLGDQGRLAGEHAGHGKRGM